MKHNIQPLTDLELKNTNGGNGIIAYDPVTGDPFAEEFEDLPVEPGDPTVPGRDPSSFGG